MKSLNLLAAIVVSFFGANISSAQTGGEAFNIDPNVYCTRDSKDNIHYWDSEKFYRNRSSSKFASLDEAAKNSMAYVDCYGPGEGDYKVCLSKAISSLSSRCFERIETAEENLRAQGYSPEEIRKAIDLD